MARDIALLTLAGLGLPGAPFHDPFHATSAWEITQLRVKNRRTGPSPHRTAVFSVHTPKTRGACPVWFPGHRRTRQPIVDALERS